MQISDLLSGFIGAILGATSSFIIAIISNKNSIKAMELERLRGYTAKAVSLAGELFDNFLFYNPKLINQNSFGMRVEENSLSRIKYSVQLHAEAKYLQYLLPQNLRKRWDMMLVLISEFSATTDLDAPNRNRAQVDVDQYIKYVIDSCVDFLDGKEIRNELVRPYLKRDDPNAWAQNSQN